MLAEASSSPTLAILLEQLLEAFPEAAWYEYEPVARRQRGHRFGAPHFDLETAEVIVCLDADLLGAHPAAVRYAREFAEGREAVEGRMNRLYVVESRFTITGAAADHRLAIRAGEIAGFAEALRTRRSSGEVDARTQPMTASDGTQVADVPPRGGRRLAGAQRGDASSRSGRGSRPRSTPRSARINAALGNVEQDGLRYTTDSGPRAAWQHVEAIETLVARDQRRARCRRC